MNRFLPVKSVVAFAQDVLTLQQEWTSILLPWTHHMWTGGSLSSAVTSRYMGRDVPACLTSAISACRNGASGLKKYPLTQTPKPQRRFGRNSPYAALSIRRSFLT